MTAGSIERLVCVAPARLTCEAQRPFLEAAQCALGSAAEHRADAVTLDVSRVEHTDAAGLGLLVMTHRRARAAGVHLVLAGAPAPLRELLVVAGLDRLFSFSGAA